jgi:lipopolysaccharide transport system permease protein
MSGTQLFFKDVKTIFSKWDLIYNLAIKDFKVRYRNATLGFLWMLLNPVLQMLVLSLVFSFIVRIPVDVPFPIFLLCGLLPWNFMAMTLGVGVSSLVNERNLVKKVYFPREIIPIAIAVGHFINFLIALLLFAPFPLIILKSWSWNLLLLPFPILLLLVFTIAITSLATLGDSFFRDTRFIVEALVMIWFYATPIFYPLSFLFSMEQSIPSWVMPFIQLIRFNPMAAIITMFRSILLYGQAPPLFESIYITAVTIVSLLVSYGLYRKHGPIIADHM